MHGLTVALSEADLTLKLYRQMGHLESKARTQHNSGQPEWYTPANIIAAAVAVMGAIDLDPASCATANEVVGAEKIFTVEDDGIRQKWKGRVWLNPPYARGVIDQFCGILLHFYRGGDVTEACVLVNNSTDSAWWQALAEQADAICHIRGRVPFWSPTGTGNPLQGSTVFYLGPNASLFREQFASLGYSHL